MSTPPKSKTAKTSKPRERGLGRGLSALLSDVPPETVSEGVTPGAGDALNQDIPIEWLERNPDQPRRIFSDSDLKELAESIRTKGVLQPLLIRPIPGAENRYQIVAGERRWRAAQMAGLHHVPVLVRELSDRDVLEIGVIENIQRADLNPIEEAEAYQALISQFNRTQEDIAEAVGKSRPYVTNVMRLLNLPERARAYVRDGKLSAGHARAILTALDPEAMADLVVTKGLSVRETEKRVRAEKISKQSPPEITPQKDADTRALEADLQNRLGLKVSIEHKDPGGAVKITYRSLEQLDDICRRLSQTPGAEGHAE